MDIKTKNQIEISMSKGDIQDAIVHYLYHKKKISGIFSITFNTTQDSFYNSTLDSATIIVDLNTSEQT